MTGPSKFLSPGAPPRSARDLVAALYRQAGLVAACALAGTVASALLYARQQPVYASTAKVWVQTEPRGASLLSGIAAYHGAPYPDAVDRRIETEIELMRTRTNAQAVVERLHIRDDQLLHGGFAKLHAGMAEPASAPTGGRPHTVDLFLDGLSVEPLHPKTADATSNVLEVRFECADPALAPVALQAFLDNYLQLGARQSRRAGEAGSRVVEGQLARAQGELRQAEDRIVALLVQDGGRGAPATGVVDARGLKLDLDPDAANSPGGSARMVAALKLQLRLDEARQLYADDPGNLRNPRSQQRLAKTVRENTRLEAELNRLERQRQLAQERYVELQRRLGQIEIYLRPNPVEAESRVVVDAPDHPTVGEGRRSVAVAWMGPLAGLVLGLLIAGLRELGGDRMRSPREAAWALGAPVLGAIPTLSAKARAAYAIPPALPAGLQSRPA